MWLFHKTTVLSRSGLLKGMVDCHSHLLPGVDDGVQSMEESLQILREMEQQGIRRVWLTPHIMEDIPNETLALQRKFWELLQQYRGAVELKLAAEYMLDNLFEERLEKEDLLLLEEGKRFLLVETSYFNPPMDLLSVLQRIQKKGYYPLLAHPERYEYMQKEDYNTLKKEHISFQLNLPSLAGMYGKHVQKKAEDLLKAGMYDRMGGDTHSAASYQRFLQGEICKNIVGFILRQKE